MATALIPALKTLDKNKWEICRKATLSGSYISIGHFRWYASSFRRDAPAYPSDLSQRISYRGPRLQGISQHATCNMHPRW